MRKTLYVFFLFLTLGVLLQLSGQDRRFTSVGLGGGGAMYAPSSSIHDPRLMFASCDMSGFYRSENGGKTWEMIDFRQTRGSTVCRPVFHPVNPNVVFFKDLVSLDKGKTWKPLVKNAPFGSNVTETALDPHNGNTIITGTDSAAYISKNSGKTWKECKGVKGPVKGICIDPSSRRIFIASENGIWISANGGASFTEESGNLPWKGIRDMTGGLSRRKTLILYCTIPSKKVNGSFKGGVFRSDDLGKTWNPVMGKGINTSIGKVDQYGDGDIPEYCLLGTASDRAEQVYVTGKGTGYWPPHHSTVYRSDNGGGTWRPVYNRDFRFAKYSSVDKGKLNVENGWIPYALSWIWGGFHTPSGFYVNPKHPDILMWTDSGNLDISINGGKSWTGAYCALGAGQKKPAPVPGKAPGNWQSVGLEVTTTWEYHIDPFIHSRHYICYTDIGFAISKDRGKTWRNNSRSGGAPWTNTTYMIAFDPKRKGRIWAAMSNRHDIPHWTHTHDGIKGPGGVCTSDDHGEQWNVTSKGLPSAPCTSIALDLRSPPGKRTLYVTLYNHGVYKSIDDGKSWKPVNNGIALDKNNHSFLVKIHKDGTLFACVTARRVGGRRSHSFPQPGALYRSRDSGSSWENITVSNPLRWPNGFDFHPEKSSIIYLAAATIPRGPEGGIYKTENGGKTWKRLLKDDDFKGKGGPSYVHGMFVTVDPRNPRAVYLGTGSQGLWCSLDSGRTWKQFGGIPFGSVQRVAFDPDDRRLIYVTTFGGGVWKGNAPVR